MTRGIRVIAEASEELTEAVRWYEEQKLGLGAEFLDAVAASFATIADGPELGAEVTTGRRERRFLVSRFPYQIVYLPTASEVVIIALAHLRRRPGYWKHR